MANWFSPQFSGKTRIKSSGAAFLEKMKARVESGLLIGKPHPRSRYAVTSHTQRELAFRASDMKTAINVGLNDAVLRVTSSQEIEYSVTYKRWAAYCVGLGLVIGTGLAATFVWWRTGIEIGAYRLAANLSFGGPIVSALVWANIAFWSLVWPWLLIAMHKPFARQLLDRIIGEVDGRVETPRSGTLSKAPFR
jgi:hypothetical protein